ncbi:unnamed protein product [Enterobius vermicularis]|uniref:Phage protein n=1 Tax=Enterobius vermicularis TaxID=51028 RepID=A0A0N4VCZ3_ENTVE|nr:unnamed protein product [Enterobius vermicularis]
MNHTTNTRFAQQKKCANRVKNIHELGIRFRFVPACDDPADVGSRECPPEELQENPCWWNGPELLSHDEAE